MRIKKEIRYFIARTLLVYFEHNDVKEMFFHKKSPGATNKTSFKDRKTARYQNLKAAAIVETFNAEY